MNILKSVTMETQHCASRYEVEEEENDESMLADLSFVSAELSPNEGQLPYIFKALEGGVFTCRSSYGSIHLAQLTQQTHFYGVGVAGRKTTPCCYCAHVFCTSQGLYDWRFYIVITRDLDTQKEVCSVNFTMMMVTQN